MPSVRKVGAYLLSPRASHSHFAGHAVRRSRQKNSALCPCAAVRCHQNSQCRTQTPAEGAAGAEGALIDGSLLRGGPWSGPRTSNSARALAVSLVRGEGFLELWTLTPDGVLLGPYSPAEDFSIVEPVFN